MKASRQLLIATAIAAVAAAGFATGAVAQDKGATPQEKCYGNVKSGKNDCGTASHSCAGKSTKDNEAAEWKYVAKGTCEKTGGKLAKPSADPAKY